MFARSGTCKLVALVFVVRQPCNQCLFVCQCHFILQIQSQRRLHNCDFSSFVSSLSLRDSFVNFSIVAVISMVSQTSPRSRSNQSPSKQRRRLADLQRRQIEHNTRSPHASVASSSTLVSRTHLKCEMCERRVKNTEDHILRHLKNKHPEIKNHKGPQEKCDDCDMWHPRSSRNNHFVTVHEGNMLVKRHEATVFNPVNLKFVVRRRKIGRLSKHFVPPSDEDVDVPSSDSDSASESPSTSPSPSPTTSRTTRGPSTVHAAQLSLSIQQALNRMNCNLQSTIDEIERAIGPIETGDEHQSSSPSTHGVQRDGHLQSTTPQTIWQSNLLAFKQAWKQQGPNSIATTATKQLQSWRKNRRAAEGNFFVACSADEARHLLDKGALSAHFYIPNADVPRLVKESVIGTVQTQGITHVLDLDQTNTEPGQQLQAMTGKEAVAQYQKPDRHIILPALPSCRSNPIPSCIADLPTHDMMQQLKDARPTSPSEPGVSGWSTSQLCATGQSLLPPQMTGYGLVQTVFVEWGGVLVLLRPQLSDTEMTAWAEAGVGAYPGTDQFCIYLGPGDLLVQPPWSVAALYFRHDSCLSLTRHVQSASLHMHVDITMFQKLHPQSMLTPFTWEIPAKFFLAAQQMIDGSSRWPWPVGDDLKTFKAGLVVSNSSMTIDLQLN